MFTAMRLAWSYRVAIFEMMRVVSDPRRHARRNDD
jgi:hypothetical protein